MSFTWPADGPSPPEGFTALEGRRSTAPHDRGGPEPVAGARFFGRDKLRGLDLTQFFGAKPGDQEGGPGDGYLNPLVRDLQYLPGRCGVVVHEERGIIELYL